MAADKTFGVKVSEELYEKVKNMVEVSGLSSKEWFEKAIALTELNEIKEGAADYKQDLSELEVHTTRIYELVSNMVQRSVYLKESAVSELTEKVNQKEALIGEYHVKIKKAQEESKTARESLEELKQAKDDISKQLEDARSTNENNQALIAEYKEKIDTLSGLVTKYQAFADENQQIKDESEKERNVLQTRIQEILAQSGEQKEAIQQLNRQISTMQQQHESELERVTERKELEKERALLQLERDYQGKLSAIQEEHNAKIKEFYNEMSSLRREYEEKIEKLKESIVQPNTSASDVADES